MSAIHGTSAFAGAIAAAFTIATAVPARAASADFVTFDEFQAALTKGGPAQISASAASRVSDGAQAQAMHAHLLSLYQGVTVKHSYVLDAQTFDCVPIRQQPSLRTAGPVRIATPPPSVTASVPAMATHPAPDTAVSAQVKPGSVDAHGNAMACAADTIPMRRVTPDEMSRFPTLADFFAKGPDGAGRAGIIPPATATHKYAHATQSVTNMGGTSYLNIWSPPINTSIGQIFSLSQHWYVNYNGSKVQTAETGWQNYPQKYKITKSALFIYWTADAYGSTGCYNLDCKAFVQTDTGVHLGASIGTNSVYGGSQYSVKLTYLLWGGNWWLGVGYKTTAAADDVRWVGYYPAKLYAPGKMQTSSSSIDFGGETVGTTKWPPMGSGHFASEGFGKAAYQRKVRYLTTTSAGWYTHEAKLTAQQPSPACYKDAMHNNTSDPNYKTYFYFGGPGGTGC